MSKPFWQQLSFPLPGTLAEAAGEMLESLGAVAVSSTAGDGEERFDLAEPTFQTWTMTRLSGLFGDDVDVTGIIDAISAVFPVDAHEFELERFADRDWERSWLEHFKPVRITSDLWICPSWCTPPDETAVNVVLDPGLAFGTGTHATTALCLQGLAALDLRGRTVVDFGCGSGVLAVAALMRGAARAVATDIDPRALDAARANAAANGVGERLELCTPGMFEDMTAAGLLRADVVVANILADALAALADVLRSCMADGALLLLSGILETQREVVEDAYKGLEFDIHSRDGWLLMTTREQ